MKVIFTCGGTAGHVNPALALAGLMKKKDPRTEILFVGTPGGMERKLAAKAGYPYESVEVSSFSRSMKIEGIRHNLRAAKNLVTARRQAEAILKSFGPDLVVGTGGYASYPMIKYAAKAGIPTAVHESNMVPGLTTKMLEGSADRIMVGFEECRQHYKHPEKICVTGTPVRGDFFDLTKEQAKEKLGVNDGRPLIVSFWGSLGASYMNEKMAEFFALEAKTEPFHHIHAMGSAGWPRLVEWCRPYGLMLRDHPSLDVREYIYDMAVAMRAADLVICRAGASTISELTALAVPAIIVPSPYVTNNHQEKNARILERHGGACVMLEQESSGKKLFELASAILSDPKRQADMSRGMASLGIPDAAERLYETVMSIRK